MTSPQDRPAARGAHWTAAACAAGLAAIHFAQAPEYLDEVRWLGVLFIVGAAVLAYTAVALLARTTHRWAWPLGALVSIGMLVGGVLSRTVGLLNFHESEWEPTLLVSFALELVYLATYGFIARRHPTTAVPYPLETPSRERVGSDA